MCVCVRVCVCVCVCVCVYVCMCVCVCRLEGGTHLFQVLLSVLCLFVFILTGAIHPVPIPLEAMSKPRTGYKIIKPTYPPPFVPTGILPPGPVGVSPPHISSLPGLQSLPGPPQRLYHPNGGGHLPHQVQTGHHSTRVSARFRCYIEQHMEMYYA